MPLKTDDPLPAFFHSLSGDRALERGPNGSYALELDAGELTTGYFTLSVEGGRGSRIAIKYAEAYSRQTEKGIQKAVRDDAAAGEIIGCEDVYLPSGGREEYQPFWFRTFRFVRLEIDTGSSPLRIDPPTYLETGYPLDVVSRVESSAQWIRPVWDISLRTLKRCMHETYEDCPYYEQLQYIMDTRSQILFTYMVSGDTRLAYKALLDYKSSMLPEGLLQSRYPSKEPQVIPIFSIYFIFMVEDYYWQTGSQKAMVPFRPAIDAILEYFNGKIGSTGLVEKLGYWEFVDWVSSWKRGVPRAVEKGPSTIHNLIYAAGLQSAARINEITGREFMAVEYRRRADEILRQVDAKCWSDKEGIYKEGPDLEEFSQHAQVWAVLTGIAQGNRAKSILKKALALDNIAQCSYVMRFYLLRALEKVGLYDRSEDLWQDWRDMLKLHLTTCPEDNVTVRSDCHGWSALPLYEFTRCILGVKPLTPGWGKIGIEPQCLSLPDFSGEVITPRGVVSIAWKRTAGHFSISGRVPDGVPFELSLPDGTVQIYLNGGSFEF